MAEPSSYEEKLSVPLRDRIVKSKEPVRGGQIHQGTTGGGRPQKNWIGEPKLQLALNEIVKTKKSIRKIALEYAIPKSTLHDYASGRIAFGSHQGPERYLNEVEEEGLITFVLGCADVGYPRTIKEILAHAQAMIDAKGIKAELSNGWWFRFKKRHPEITSRSCESLSKARMAASSRKVLDKYYDKLQETLTENGIMNKPGHIFNCDETGFPLEHKTGKIVTRTGQKHTYNVTSGNKTQITVMACVSAAGYALPPMVIYDRKGLNPQWTEGEVPGTRYGLNETGWIDSNLFDGWFQEVFLKFIPAVRPILLLLDGHSSHFNPAVIKQAAEDNIIIFCLPPNTTHMVQPLDRACFTALKGCWYEECRKYTQANPGKVVTRAQFCKLFSSAWAGAMNVRNITASFKMTGIIPFNRFAIQLPGEQNIVNVKEVEYIDSTVAFIPFFSPSRQEHRRKYTTDQLALFEQRYDNGYDLLHDDMYNSWLQENHPDSAILVQPHKVLAHAQTITPMKSRLISNPKKPALHLPAIPVALQKATRTPISKVLTSEENLKQIHEKAKRKEEDAKRKQERKQEKERKTREQKERKIESKARVSPARKASEEDVQGMRSLAKESHEKDTQAKMPCSKKQAKLPQIREVKTQKSLAREREKSKPQQGQQGDPSVGQNDCNFIYHCDYHGQVVLMDNHQAVPSLVEQEGEEVEN